MREQEMTPQDAGKAELMRKTLLRKFLSREAMERLSRIKLVKPDAAAQLEAYMIDLYQSGKIRGEVSEDQMKMVLETLSGRRNFRIVRK